jgi:hypothetical protein
MTIIYRLTTLLRIILVAFGLGLTVGFFAGIHFARTTSIVPTAIEHSAIRPCFLFGLPGAPL